jgi:hypothetical protein
MAFRSIWLLLVLAFVASSPSSAAIAVSEIGSPCGGSALPGYRSGCEGPSGNEYQYYDVVLIRKGTRIRGLFGGWAVSTFSNDYYWISRQEFLDKVRKAPQLKDKVVRVFNRTPTWNDFFSPYGDPNNPMSGEEMWSYVCTYPTFLPNAVDPSKDKSQWSVNRRK